MWCSWWPPCLHLCWPPTELTNHAHIDAAVFPQVIRSTYELEVTAKTGCCLSEATLKQPIVINDPQPHSAPPAVLPPPGWAPQVWTGLACMHVMGREAQYVGQYAQYAGGCTQRDVCSRCCTATGASTGNQLPHRWLRLHCQCIPKHQTLSGSDTTMP